MHLLFVYCMSLFFNAPNNLQQLRELFPLIGTNEAANKKMILAANQNASDASAIKKAYLAGAQMASANFKLFPLAKYQAFLEGKKLLEESVAMDKQNPEIRFVRYVIQSQLPAFLFYHQNMDEDKNIILKSLPTLKSNDPDLYSRIIAFIKL